MDDYSRKRTLAFFLILFLLLVSALYALSVGGYGVGINEVLRVILNGGTLRERIVLFNMRLPRIAAAILVGASLALSGAVMQAYLRNPLATPFTMGVSHGAMFGASLAILLGIGYTTGSPAGIVLLAFLGALTSTVVIIALAKLRGLSPEAIVLAGVAMSSLFMALTVFIQYFANELQLAAMVYWSFGDLGRADWGSIWIMLVIFSLSFVYFFLKRYDLNASTFGDEVALSVGVEIERDRLVGTLVAALLTSVTVAFVGVIGFIGLIAPHAVRITLGGDHHYLLPTSAVVGSLLLLLSDTAARTLMAPNVLPVGILTSFLGAPTFIYLLLRMEGRR
jgi:iron complex transport system permease protein